MAHEHDRAAGIRPRCDEPSDVRLGVGVVALAPCRVVEALLHVDHDEGGGVVEVHALMMPRAASLRGCHGCHPPATGCQRTRYRGPVILEHAHPARDARP